jgi:DNA-binding NtrC family response regulator
VEIHQNRETSDSSPTVLVVDDDPGIRHLCATVLQQAGFTVLQAEGSSEALRICTEYNGGIDLLLTDLILPPPGFQLASSSNQFPHVHGHVLAARAATFRKGLRVALMSGNPGQELSSHHIRRGALPFLQKPFEKAGLIQFVREVLASPPLALDKSHSGNANPDIDWFG